MRGTLAAEVSYLTLRLAARFAGGSVRKLAEAAIAREAAVLQAKAEREHSRQLDSLVERLRSHKEEDFAADIAEFARAEVTEEDPLQARRIVAEDPHGIGAAFGHRLERRSP